MAACRSMYHGTDEHVHVSSRKNRGLVEANWHIIIMCQPQVFPRSAIDAQRTLLLCTVSTASLETVCVSGKLIVADN